MKVNRITFDRIRKSPYKKARFKLSGRMLTAIDDVLFRIEQRKRQNYIHKNCFGSNEPARITKTY